MSAIRATFSDFRTVKSRKVAQLVMEVPIEEADAALRTLGGVPRPDIERWVGIAPITAQPREKQSRRWEDLTNAQQAGIRCNEGAFQKWLSVSDADEAAAQVREQCAVDSRAELDTDADAARRWHDMDADYEAWLRT